MVQLDGKKKNLKFVSYCGLFCPDCPLYAGNVSNLAISLRKELRRLKYDKFAKHMSQFPSGKDFVHFDEFYSVLGGLVKYRCDKGCRLGGGAKDCVIRECNLEKKIDGCWQCPKYRRCKKLDVLNSLHGDKHRKNLEILREKGVNEYLTSWRNW